MAKSVKFGTKKASGGDTSFNFGFNVTPKKKASTKKGSGGGRSGRSGS